jgi:hypothetical protein
MRAIQALSIVFPLNALALVFLGLFVSDAPFLQVDVLNNLQDSTPQFHPRASTMPDLDSTVPQPSDRSERISAPCHS